MYEVTLPGDLDISDVIFPDGLTEVPLVGTGFNVEAVLSDLPSSESETYAVPEPLLAELLLLL